MQGTGVNLNTVQLLMSVSHLLKGVNFCRLSADLLDLIGLAHKRRTLLSHLTGHAERTVKYNTGILFLQDAFHIRLCLPSAFSL
jgi:hypothetical protein